MPSGYTADEQAAAVIAGGIADGPTSIKAGNTTVQSTTTASTTASVTHGLTGTPDFCIAQSNKADVAAVAWSANSTTLTFTVTSATGFIISYIAGYTA